MVKAVSVPVSTNASLLTQWVSTGLLTLANIISVTELAANRNHAPTVFYHLAANPPDAVKDFCCFVSDDNSQKGRDGG